MQSFKKILFHRLSTTMPGKIFLNLFILGAILSQIIIGTFADKDIKESPSILLRQKRVVSHIPREDHAALIADHPYIVHLKYLNRIHCMGAILSHCIVISSAKCAEHDEKEYKVVSGTARSNHITAAHNVTLIKKRFGSHPGRRFDGVALLTIDPPIVYGRFSNKIDLHTGPTIPGMIGTVSGWGYNCRNPAGRGTSFPRELRSIQVPIITHKACIEKYKNIYPISESEICTYHPLRHCGHTDFGAPLVIDGFLVGIFLRSGQIMENYNPQFPDVFALLLHFDYNEWIRENI